MAETKKSSKFFTPGWIQVVVAFVVAIVTQGFGIYHFGMLKAVSYTHLAERGLLEAPRLRQLRHGAQRQAAQVHRVLALGAALAGEADAHAAVRLHVGPVRAQTVVADDQVLGNVPYQVVVELPRRVVAVRAGEAYSVVAGVVRAAVFLGASHGRTVPLSRAEPPDGRLLRGRSRRPCPYLQ